MKRRILAMLMSLVLMIGILPVTALAVDVIDSGKCGENLTWKFTDDGVLTISGEGEMYDYHGENPKWRQLNVKSVVIEKGVINIGAYAFSYCVSIENVVISETVGVIGDFAFHGCDSLNEVEISNGVTSIEWNSFGFCKSLTSIKIPASVDYINPEAFMRCDNLKEFIVDKDSEYFCNDERGVLYSKDKRTLYKAPIVGINGSYIIPDSVTEIGYGAFSYCEGLTEIIIPESVTFIDEQAFYNCHGLTEIILPSGLTQISQHTFTECVNLTKIEIPDGVRIIDSYAFYLCERLSEVTIPDSVIVIGVGVFQDCNSLREIKVPDSVTRISLWAFDCSDNILNVVFEGTTPEFTHTDIFSDGTTVFYPRNDTTWDEVKEYITDEVSWVQYNANKQQIGDLDGDGKITNADLVMLARIIVGL